MALNMTDRDRGFDPMLQLRTSPHCLINGRRRTTPKICGPLDAFRCQDKATMQLSTPHLNRDSPILSQHVALNLNFMQLWFPKPAGSSPASRRSDRHGICYAHGAAGESEQLARWGSG